MNDSLQTKSLEYSSSTINRAEIALFCAPFNLSLFQAMRNQSVPLPTIADQRGIDAGYSKKKVSEFQAEAHLVWLIKIGFLRREVDGQGLTDSFRLTPLGRYSRFN